MLKSLCPDSASAAKPLKRACSALFSTPSPALAVFACLFLFGCSHSYNSGTTNSAPAITTQPVNQSVAVGQTAMFAVSASGTGSLGYQWQENNSPIPGATSATHITPPTALSDNGETFRVIVTDPYGSATSNSATLTVTSSATSGTDVVMFKNDFARTGQNLTETSLALSNVAQSTFGLLRNLSVTGKVDAQPLYLSHLMISGVSHNAVYVSTEHDLIYAFDSDTGTMLWSTNVALTGETPSDDHGCGQVTPEIGSTPTPTIDRSAGANGTIFVGAMTKDSTGSYHHRLHALDLTSGAELLGGPKEISATFPNSSGVTTFVPGDYKERPGLLLLNGTIYLEFSSHCDFEPYTAWVMAYKESNLTQTTVLNLAPNSGGGGPSIWMSGAAPAVDSAGNIFLLAANGVFETTLNSNGFPTGGDYGNAFVKISTANNSLAVSDYFEMSIEAHDNANDLDLGSGGAMLLPDLMDSTGAVHHLAMGAGKDGNLYVVNRDNMSHFNSGGDNIWQEFTNIFPNGGIFSSPAYFNNTVYIGDVSGTLKAFAITNAKLGSAPASQSAITFAYPGTSPVVSANSASNGIVWTAENVNPAVLHAYDATNLAHELYNSSQAGVRDQCGNGNKFIVPTVADGKVFLGTQNSVCVFGLLNPSPASANRRSASRRSKD